MAVKDEFVSPRIKIASGFSIFKTLSKKIKDFEINSIGFFILSCRYSLFISKWIYENNNNIDIHFNDEKALLNSFCFIDNFEDR